MLKIKNKKIGHLNFFDERHLKPTGCLISTWWNLPGTIMYDCKRQPKWADRKSWLGSARLHGKTARTRLFPTPNHIIIRTRNFAMQSLVTNLAQIIIYSKDQIFVKKWSSLSSCPIRFPETKHYTLVVQEFWWKKKKGKRAKLNLKERVSRAFNSKVKALYVKIKDLHR